MDERKIPISLGYLILKWSIFVFLVCVCVYGSHDVYVKEKTEVFHFCLFIFSLMLLLLFDDYNYWMHYFGYRELSAVNTISDVQSNHETTSKTKLTDCVIEDKEIKNDVAVVQYVEDKSVVVFQEPTFALLEMNRLRLSKNLSRKSLYGLSLIFLDFSRPNGGELPLQSDKSTPLDNGIKMKKGPALTLGILSVLLLYGILTKRSR